MKALITGAGGQVGRALLSSVPADTTAIAYSHADLDIADEQTVLSAVRTAAPDLIINAAAYTAVDRAETEIDAARRINADGVRQLAAAARWIGARLIHISTDFVFDGRASVPYAPDAPTNPLSVYGLTKREGELAALKTLPDNCVIVRTAWVYAAEGSNFVRTMLRLMSTNGTVKVVADQIGTPTAAHSLAETLWKIAARPEIGGVHHWTDAGVASWYDFAVAIAEEAARLGLISAESSVVPIATSDYPTRAHRPGFSVLDKQSLIKLGFMPRHWRKNLLTVLEEMRRA